MNTLKGNEEAARRGSFRAELGVGELSERFVTDLSSQHEKQEEVEFNGFTNGNCSQIFLDAAHVGAEAESIQYESHFRHICDQMS